MALSLGLALASARVSLEAQFSNFDKAHVFLFASALTDPLSGGAGTPAPNQVVSPSLNPLVRLAGPSETDHEVTIQIPDMDPTGSGPRAGVQEGIASGAVVTVVIAQQAGIRNPFEAGTFPVNVAVRPSGGEVTDVTVQASPNTAGLPAEFRITFTVSSDIPANSGSIVITFDEDYLFPGEGLEAVRKADISLSSPDFPATVRPGDRFSYQIIVTNAGPDDATGVVLTEGVPRGLVVESVEVNRGSCDRSPSQVTCELGRLSPQDIGVVTIQMRVEPVAGGVLEAISRVIVSQHDPVSVNDQLVKRASVAPRPTPSPTATPTATPPPTSTPEPTPPPTATPEPTPTPLVIATFVPTAIPTAIPTVAPALAPTATPVPAATAAASVAATPIPPAPIPSISELTAAATDLPTPAPEPTPTPPPTPSGNGACSAPAAPVRVFEGSWALLLITVMGLALVGRRRRSG